MTSITPSILIIGVGNEYRGDDCIGILTARELSKRLTTEARIIESPCGAADLVETWKQYRTVIIIDATQSGSPPGTIHRFDARTSTMPPQLCHSSSHAFGLADTIELARVMDWLPPNLIIYGIEGKDFPNGSILSKQVAEAIPILVDRVCSEKNERFA